MRYRMKIIKYVISPVLKSYENTYYTKLSILPSKLTSALPYNVHGGPYILRKNTYLSKRDFFRKCIKTSTLVK